MSALPGVVQNSAKTTQFNTVAADVIPQNVLTHPIIGEARRFDGTAAPAGWMLMQGDTLKIADDRALFHVLGVIAGGDGKTTFKLPKPKQGWIIAVAGNFPSTPDIFAQVGRQPTLQASLGAGAQQVFTRTFPTRVQRLRDQRDAAVREQLKLANSAIRTSSSAPGRLSPELNTRIEQTRSDARTTVLAALSGENRQRAEGLVESILASGISVYHATRQMSASLSPGESAAVLGVFDATQRALGGNVIGHPDPALEAGRYIIEITFTPDQLTRLRAMPGDQ